MGVLEPGSISATIGTSGVVFAATGSPVKDRLGRLHTFCHAASDRWHVMGVTNAAVLSLRYFRDTFNTQTTYEELSAEAASTPPGLDGLLYSLYLFGERKPHLDPEARAAFVGIAASHRLAHFVRAILEGVAFSLRDSLGLFEELQIPVTRIRLGGGGARSALWRQIRADVYGHTVEVLEAEEGGAYRAALLADTGVGAWPSVEAVCTATVRVAASLAPQSAATMEEAYRRYLHIYPALRAIR